MDQANKLFQKFSKDSTIPHKFPLGLCHARATMMSKIAESEGVITARLYVSGNLEAQTKNKLYPRVRWGWHVAPVTFVMQPDGTKEVYVYDPALFEKPVPKAEWEKKLTDPSDGYNSYIAGSAYGSRFQFFRKHEELNRTDWDTQDVEYAKKVLKENYEFQFRKVSNTKNEVSPKTPDRPTPIGGGSYVY